MTATPYTFPPFEALLTRVRRQRISTWVAIEDEFLRCVSAFDALFVRVSMTEGQYKTKARYFNDLIGLILQHQTGQTILTRTKRPGLVLSKIDIDLLYPANVASAPIAAGEVKIAGTPPHPGNEKSAGEAGRAAARDIHKRCREIGLNVIDMKRRKTPRLVMVRASILAADPLYVAVYAARVTSDKDLAQVAGVLKGFRDGAYIDGVGLFFYRATTGPTTYQKTDPGPGLRIDEVLRMFSERVARH